MRRRLEEDRPFRAYYEQETDVLPPFYIERVRQDLGSLWSWLPEGALLHDPNAWLKERAAQVATAAAIPGAAAIPVA